MVPKWSLMVACRRVVAAFLAWCGQALVSRHSSCYKTSRAPTLELLHQRPVQYRRPFYCNARHKRSRNCGCTSNSEAPPDEPTCRSLASSPICFPRVGALFVVGSGFLPLPKSGGQSVVAGPAIGWASGERPWTRRATVGECGHFRILGSGCLRKPSPGLWRSGPAGCQYSEGIEVATYNWSFF